MVRVAVKAAGVCMSDWHIINGDWPLTYALGEINEGFRLLTTGAVARGVVMLN